MNNIFFDFFGGNFVVVHLFFLPPVVLLVSVQAVLTLTHESVVCKKLMGQTVIYLNQKLKIIVE